jgi:hypothetical protein
MRKNTPHGVSPENWKIGADAAMALQKKSTCPSLLQKPWAHKSLPHFEILCNAHMGCQNGGYHSGVTVGELYGMQHHIIWAIITSVSKDHKFFSFRIKQS